MVAGTREPGRRQEIEDWLDSFGVDWTYAGLIDSSRIDPVKSQQNQARLDEELDQDVVDTYAEAVKRGDEYPAMVAHQTSPRAKLILIDGNHRKAGYAKAEASQIPAYIVKKARPNIVVQMTFQANVKHGKPTSHSDRLEQGVWLLRGGASMNHAPALVNVKESDLKKRWAAAQADERADEAGILRTTWESISRSSRNRLLNISTDEELHIGCSGRSNDQLPFLRSHVLRQRALSQHLRVGDLVLRYSAAAADDREDDSLPEAS